MKTRSIQTIAEFESKTVDIMDSSTTVNHDHL